MAELSALEELLLGSNGLAGYDVGLLLAGAQAAAEPGLGLGVLGIDPLPQQLPQQPLNWASADQTAFYQEVAQSLAARLEEQRLQQAQTAAVLQHFQALQQQQQLAQLQQQVNMLQEQSPRGNPFRRSRTTDLEPVGHASCFDMAGAYSAAALDFDQRQQLQVLQAVNPAAQLGGFQRSPGLVSQHSLPVRSFSSEHLMAGQRRMAQAPPSPSPLAAQGNGKKPPYRQPSSLGPNARNGQGRPADGSRRARYAATAKAPSWASEDWHPMKAVIASGTRATGGTGVFLPHLAGAGAAAGAGPDNRGASASGMLPERSATDTGAGSGPTSQGSVGDGHVQPGGHASQNSSVGASQSPASPHRGSSPACSVESSAMGSVDAYSRQTTLEFSRASTRSELDSHSLSTMGHLIDTMKVVVEEPEREREEECDFSSLARELAELMNKHVDAE